MIYKGKHRGKLFHGDQHPASLYSGNRLIAGFRLAKKAAEGRVELGEQPYKAALPSVVVQGVGKQEKLTGKNLFDINSELKDYEGNRPAVVGNDLIIRPGEGNPIGGYFTKKIKVSTGKWSFSSVVKKGTMRWCLSFYNNDGIRLSDKNISFSTPDFMYLPYYKGWFDIYDQPSISIDIPDGVACLTYTPIAMNSGVSENIISNIQIEKGSTPTPYEPYCGGIPAPNPEYPIEPEFLEGASLTDGTNTANIPILRALPGNEYADSVIDEFDCRSGKLVRRVGRKILNSAIRWNENNSFGDYVSFYMRLHGRDILLGPNYSTHLCSHAPYESWYALGNKAGDYWWYAGVSAGMRIHKKYLGADFDTLSAPERQIRFAKWLDDQQAAGTPVTIWYPLAAPIIEHYDPQILRQHPGYTQLIQQGGFAPAPITAEFYEHKE